MDTSTIDVDPAELLAAFERATLPPAALDHRTHLRLGFVYLERERDLAAAALAFRRALRRYVDVHGASHRYHETITWAYLCLLEQQRVAAPGASFDDVIRRVPELLDHRAGALARLYDVAAITACPLAARTFVLPQRGRP
jgi:hypothetical protein